MTLETFFEKFNQIADAPDAVAKMRELVLDLAVRGKLVVQDVTDEPAAQLLKRVLAEKNRQTGRIENSHEEPGSLTDDEAFEIPVNWEWIGATTPAVMVSDQGKKVQTKDILEAGMYPVIDQGKMFIRGYCDDSDRVISVAEPIVLFGDHTRETKFIDFDFVVGADGVKLLQPICIDPRFYFLMLRWLPLESRGYARHFKLLKAARIPLPPLAEQKRIVAKVDELMALCDRLEAQQQERETRHAALARASLARFADAPTPANLGFLFHPSYSISPADLRKSILTLAVQGKLVPQDSSDETAEDALRRCGVNMKRWAVSEVEVRHAVPSSWTWIRFAGVGEQRLGKMLDAQKNRGVFKPYLRNTNVQWMRFEFDDVKEMRVEEREEEELRLKKGDLLICEGGEPGRCAIWRDEVSDMYFQKALHRVRPCDEILSEFLALNLQIDCRNSVLAGYFTGATIKHLTGRSLSVYPIPIPPLAEQRRIVAKVDQLMALVDELERQLAASRATAAKLLEALVAELTAPQPVL